jgi:hypothetical protein
VKTALLVDNDVMIKCACYQLLCELRGLDDPPTPPCILGAARYMVERYLARRGTISNRPGAQACFTAFLSTACVLEPTDEEIRLATAIEEVAIRLGAQLDSGESQLCAIAFTRGSSLVLTGDKRAICGAESLRGEISWLSDLEGRIVCLEQIIKGIAERIGHRAARSRVCSEPYVDKSLTICFECTSPERPEFLAHGLESYIADLRRQAPKLLYGPAAL